MTASFFRNETVNLTSHDCHSYLHVILTNGIPPRKAMVMAGENVGNLWMRKSTATMVPREMRLKKLQLVIDEQSPMRMKSVSLIFSGEAKTARTLRTPEPPTDAARMAHNATQVHSEIGARSVLRVVDEVLRTDELW